MELQQVCHLVYDAIKNNAETVQGIEIMVQKPDTFVHTVDIENKRILVIYQLQEQDMNKDYQEVLTSNEYSQAIWVNQTEPSRYKKGDEIEISYEVMIPFRHK